MITVPLLGYGFNLATQGIPLPDIQSCQVMTPSNRPERWRPEPETGTSITWRYRAKWRGSAAGMASTGHIAGCSISSHDLHWLLWGNSGTKDLTLHEATAIHQMAAVHACMLGSQVCSLGPRGFLNTTDCNPGHLPPPVAAHNQPTSNYPRYSPI